jgi:hypothetical protein
MSFEPATFAALAAVAQSPEARHAVGKLLDTIGDQIGLWMKPFHTRRQAKAEADAMIEGARAQNEIDLANEKSKGERAIVKLQSREAVAEFEDRIRARRSAEDARNQENLEAITAEAAKALNDQSRPVEDQPVDPDWVASFINSCKDVSDKQMQGLWARILAGEVTKPGSFSLRTLAFVRTMSKAEAELFTRFCSTVWQNGSGEPHSLTYDPHVLGHIGGLQLTYKDLGILNSIGLIIFEPSTLVATSYLAPPAPAEMDEFVVLWSYFGRQYKFSVPLGPEHHASTSQFNLKTGYVLLTPTETELFRIVGDVSNEYYRNMAIAWIENQGWRVRPVGGDGPAPPT